MSTRSAGGWPPPGQQRRKPPHGWQRGGRTESSRVTGTRRWRVLRASVLRHANYECEVDGCEREAVAVDHVQRVSAGGAPYDEANCQALCKPHHDAKTAAEGAAAAAAKRAAPKPRRRSQLHPADVLRGDGPPAGPPRPKGWGVPPAGGADAGAGIVHGPARNASENSGEAQI